MRVQTDSRKVKPGDTFIAIKGEKYDGHDFIENAINNGASKIIAEHGDYRVYTRIVSDTKKYLYYYLNKLYGEKIDKMNIMGVTGTNGKTTTAFLIYKALNMLNQPCAYIGTIGFYRQNKVMELDRTTPEVADIYNMLLDCVENGIFNVSMEVSSHALALGRVKNLKFNTAIFTNLTGDHLDFHKTFENYALAKKQLFEQITLDGCAIINSDDENAHIMLNPKNKNITYGFSADDYRILRYFYDKNVMKFDYRFKDMTHNVTTKLLGKYNVYNLMSLIIALEGMGLDSHQIMDTVKELEAPSGRFEVLKFGSNRVVIDYAHTVDAVNNVLNTTKEFSRGKIYSIIGCGGDRDKTKRSDMLRSALELSDKVIITNDNPRTEDELSIVRDMLKGNEGHGCYEILLDREEAIKRGISFLKDNDTLMILGKGHENYQIIGDKKYHHDDREVALQYIKKR